MDYNLSSLSGYRFTAKMQLNKYSDTGRTKIGTIEKGGFIGTLYSWVQRDKDLWLMFNDVYGKPFYVKYIPYSIDNKDLRNQGALNALEELQKQKEKDMTAFELFMSKHFPKIVLALILLIAVSGLSKNPGTIKRLRYAVR